MKTRTILSFGLSAMLLGGTMVGCSASHTMLASAGTRDMTKAERKADDSARDARKQLAKGRTDKAVEAAEQAVAYAPQNGEHRALLGQVYLQAGRFTSASQALQDALTLDPANGKAALNLALAQTALGDWVSARKTLNDHSDQIAPADRGLALALAGDPATAVQILSVVARGPSANATTRQNLALALALDGKWKEAKSVASVDVSPALVDKRIMEWAAFARPKSASDQVAALLGVVPVADQGQPVQLALNDTNTQLAAVSPVAPADAFAPADSNAADQPEMKVAAAVEPAPQPKPEPQPAAVLASSGPAVSFAPRREIVQPIPVSGPKVQPVAVATRDVPKAMPKPASKPAELAKGNYYVQLGAFENAAVAQEKWQHMRRRVHTLAALTPMGMNAKVDGQQFYRLSVGGYARNDAVGLCDRVRASGGRCFVRTGAGEQVASWTREGVQLASR
ncbi:tetratricopeptide repeat protein [Stakelama marina]|uniref:Tetratricopeptide repeat protein n=1 Tax=Stakelama marina TaxID=2826939 RepID=A0A8T4IC64_9SPHN|nr:tetratricopeptide repeat protein [Stakelama marina]MBR0551981.1 tetratricopeptide repeat protein [Stakelama marina]